MAGEPRSRARSCCSRTCASTRARPPNDPAFAANLIRARRRLRRTTRSAPSHRAHASIVGPPRVLPSAAGRLLAREVEVLGGAARRAEAARSSRSSAASKVSDKLGVIDALLERVRHAAHRRRDGVHVPRRAGLRASATRSSSPTRSTTAARCSRPAASWCPTDVVVAQEMTADARRRATSAPVAIPDGWKGLDIGPETAGDFADAIAGRGDGAVERPDGRVRARAVRGRHAHGRRGGRRLPRASP